MRVSVDGDGIVAQTASLLDAFDPVPWNECTPPQFLLGMRKVLRVEDGWLVAYAALESGELSWMSEDHAERRVISGARIAGFARTPSGTILALAIGRARLGRGGVVALERRGRGDYRPRLVAALPVEPSAVAFEEGGALFGYAEGFVFRVTESGAVENVHYVARNVGRVSSLAKSAAGVYYLGLECGVLRIDGEREEWWSASLAAPGLWGACTD